jgi:uroporphyrinogen-III decarboxylase
MEHMTSKQRFMAALNGAPLDRPPAASIVSVINYELMDIVGSTR